MAYPYKDLEQILFRCFITEPIYIGGVPILLKSLSEHEFDYINETYFFLDNEEEKFLYYAAYSFLQVEGKSVLEHRPESLEYIVSIIQHWPDHIFTDIAVKMSEFKNRVERALPLLEVYSYTDASRMRWFAYKNRILNEPQITGWAGTDKIALSSAQLSWITLNRMEDERLHYEALNDASRFVATVYNAKGMKTINEDESTRRKMEMNRRREAIEEINRMYDEGLEDELETKSFVLTEEERRNMDSKDLAEELRRMKEGIKDEHDLGVEAYERELKRIYLEDKKRKEALIYESVSKKSGPDYTTSLAAVSRIMDESELEQSKQEKIKEFSEKERLYASVGRNPIPEALMDKLGAMGKLDDEDEQYLRKDVYREVAEKVVKKPNNSLMGEEVHRVVKSPTFDEFKKQMGM